MHCMSGKDILLSICLNKLYSHGKTAFSFYSNWESETNIAHKTPGLLNTYLQSQPRSQSKVFVISDNGNMRTLSVIDSPKTKRLKIQPCFKVHSVILYGTTSMKSGGSKAVTLFSTSQVTG